MLDPSISIVPLNFAVVAAGCDAVAGAVVVCPEVAGTGAAVSSEPQASAPITSTRLSSNATLQAPLIRGNIFKLGIGI